MKTVNKWIIGSLVGLAIIGIANGNSQPSSYKQYSLTQGQPSQQAENYQKSVPYEAPENLKEKSDSQPLVETTNPRYKSQSTQKYYKETAPVPESPVSYYTNTYGNEVQSPTYYNAQPSGASALCRDGTYSFSQSRRGTCSHHGGVDEWL